MMGFCYSSLMSDPFSKKSRLLFLLTALFLFLANPVQAQDLEPRRWTHLPVGLNVLGAGLASSSGNILFDPALLIEDADYDLSIAGLSYVRAFDLFGKTARVDVVAPFVKGRWEGLVDGVDTTVRRKGLADPWVRFSVNLYGGPALKSKDYMQYRSEKQVHTTVGAGISVIVPVGQYSQEFLINLGNNRWVIRPQLGVLHQRKKWQFEVTGSVFLYQTNKEFWKETVREQAPLWFVQSHIIYNLNPKWWTSLSMGFAHGGRSTINNAAKLDDARTSFMALGLGFNINRSQGLKVAYLRSRSNTSLGRDTDTFSLGWSYRWTR